MRKKIIKSAHSRLALAKRLIAEYESAATLSEKKDAWFQILIALAAVYEKLRAGAKEAGGPASGWFGRLLATRKNDELLRYIHHARDVDYHGLEESTIVEKLRLNLLGGMVAFEFDVPEDADLDEFVAQHVTPHLDGYEITVDRRKLTADEVIKSGLASFVRSAHLRLVTVTDNRQNASFDPPTMHLGAPIDGTNPLAVANAAATYLTSVLKEANDFAAD